MKAIISFLTFIVEGIARAVVFLLSTLGLWIPALFCLLFVIICAVTQTAFAEVAGIFFVGLALSVVLALSITVARVLRKREKKHLEKNGMAPRSLKRKKDKNKSKSDNQPQSQFISPNIVQPNVPSGYAPVMQQGYYPYGYYGGGYSQQPYGAPPAPGYNAQPGYNNAPGYNAQPSYNNAPGTTPSRAITTPPGTTPSRAITTPPGTTTLNPGTTDIIPMPERTTAADAKRARACSSRQNAVCAPNLPDTIPRLRSRTLRPPTTRGKSLWAYSGRAATRAYSFTNMPTDWTFGGARTAADWNMSAPKQNALDNKTNISTKTSKFSLASDDTIHSN